MQSIPTHINSSNGPSLNLELRKCFSAAFSQPTIQKPSRRKNSDGSIPSTTWRRIASQLSATSALTLQLDASHSAWASTQATQRFIRPCSSRVSPRRSTSCAIAKRSCRDVDHIAAAGRGARKAKLKLCVRLNGATDIAWESKMAAADRSSTRFPHVQFVDYTKSSKALAHARSQLAPQLPLTFSRAKPTKPTASRTRGRRKRRSRLRWRLPGQIPWPSRH